MKHDRLFVQDYPIIFLNIPQNIYLVNLFGIQQFIGEMQQDKDLYIVERILARKKTKTGIFLYKIKWKDWPTNTSTWQPIQHLQLVIEMVKKFDKRCNRKASKKRNAQLLGDKNRVPNEAKSDGQKSEKKSNLSREKGSANSKQISEGKLIQKRKKIRSEKTNPKRCKISTKRPKKIKQNLNEEPQKLEIDLIRMSSTIQEAMEPPAEVHKKKRIRKRDKDGQEMRVKIKKIRKVSRDQLSLKKTDNNNQEKNSRQQQGVPDQDQKVQKKQKKIKKRRSPKQQNKSNIQEKDPQRQSEGGQELKLDNKSDNGQGRKAPLITQQKAKRKRLWPKIKLLKEDTEVKYNNQIQGDKTPFTIQLCQAQDRLEVVQRIKKERKRSRKLQIRPSFVLFQQKPKRIRKKRTFSQIFFHQNFRPVNPSTFYQSQNKNFLNRSSCSSSQQQKQTLKQQLLQYNPKLDYKMDFNQDRELRIKFYNQNQEECYFMVEDLKKFNGQWMKQFYQEFI